MRSLVVMLSGWRYSGKDTAASRLVKNFKFHQTSFAGPLKDMTAELYGIERAWMDDPLMKDKPLESYPVDARDAYSKTVTEFLKKEFRQIPGKEGFFWTPRALLILEGSTKRTANPNYWVDTAADKCRGGGLHVISDARYKNEISRMMQHFQDRIISLRIERFDDCISTDPSERDLDDWNFDFRISNRGTIQEFEVNIDAIVERMLVNK